MFIVPHRAAMPGSTWAQKLSGSTVLFIIAIVCFIVGWVTRLQDLITVAYVLFIIVALMGLYALCFTTKLSKGGPFTAPTSVVHVQPGQRITVYPQSATAIAVVPVHFQHTATGFHPGFTNDRPPPYSAAVKQPYSYS